MKCNLNCPFPAVTEKALRNIKFCYTKCDESRKCHLEKHPDLEKQWSDEDGFASKDGCRLTRKEMPKDCKEYDCHDFDFFFQVLWDGNQWNVMARSKPRVR